MLPNPDKQNLINPEHHIGKRLDPNKWNIPDGYVLCRKTGMLVREQDALITFFHWAFDRQWLIEKNIYVEDADWLTLRGYEEIMEVLRREGQLDAYYRAVWEHR